MLIHKESEIIFYAMIKGIGEHRRLQRFDKNCLTAMLRALFETKIIKTRSTKHNETIFEYNNCCKYFLKHKRKGLRYVENFLPVIAGKNVDEKSQNQLNCLKPDLEYITPLYIHLNRKKSKGVVFG